LRIERWDVGGKFGDREREIAGEPYIRTRAHHLAFAHARAARDPQRLPRDTCFAYRRKAIGFVGGAQSLADAGERSAQRALDAFGCRGKIGFAVKRSENGATHERGAAKSGQDRAAEPLQRDPAPIDERTGAAVDRKRRIVAEFDGLGPRLPVCAAHPALVQDPVPPHSRSRSVCRRLRRRAWLEIRNGSLGIGDRAELKPQIKAIDEGASVRTALLRPDRRDRKVS
jgi:hypothetical protein